MTIHNTCVPWKQKGIFWSSIHGLSMEGVDFKEATFMVNNTLIYRSNCGSLVHLIHIIAESLFFHSRKSLLDFCLCDPRAVTNSDHLSKQHWYHDTMSHGHTHVISSDHNVQILTVILFVHTLPLRKHALVSSLDSSLCWVPSNLEQILNKIFVVLR